MFYDLKPDPRSKVQPKYFPKSVHRGFSTKLLKAKKHQRILLGRTLPMMVNFFSLPHIVISVLLNSSFTINMSFPCPCPTHNGGRQQEHQQQQRIKGICLPRRVKGDIFDSWPLGHSMSCQLVDIGCTEGQLSSSSHFPPRALYLYELAVGGAKAIWFVNATTSIARFRFVVRSVEKIQEHKFSH